MIRLQPHPCPPELTDDVSSQLTQAFLADNTKPVWKQDYIVRALMKMSHDKCCYCECKIHEESKYPEVEHFYPKKWYPELVVAWENLLPACKRCNGNKRDHDTGKDPILHPVKDEPKDHLKLVNYWFLEKTTLGKQTIRVIKLNDIPRRMVEIRLEIDERFHKELVLLEHLAQDLLDGIVTTNLRKELIVNKMKVILSECLPQSRYAAASATFLVNKPLFLSVKSILRSCHLWDEEMTRMENIAREIALEVF